MSGKTLAAVGNLLTSGRRYRLRVGLSGQRRELPRSTSGEWQTRSLQPGALCDSVAGRRYMVDVLPTPLEASLAAANRIEPCSSL